MEQKVFEEIERKAEILIRALPYIRDFNRQVAVIEYGCRKYLSPVAEQDLMQDIALLKTVGMKPVVVHDAPMGVDKFRENKRIAKLLEWGATPALHTRASRGPRSSSACRTRALASGRWDMSPGKAAARAPRDSSSRTRASACSRERR